MSPQKGTPEYVELHYAITSPLSSATGADTQSFNLRVADNWKANPQANVASDSIAIPQANVLSWYLTYSTDRVQQCDTPIQSFKNGQLSSSQEQNALNAAWRTLMPLSQSLPSLQQAAVRQSNVNAHGTINAAPLSSQQATTSTTGFLGGISQQPIMGQQAGMMQAMPIRSNLVSSSLLNQQPITSATQFQQTVGGMNRPLVSLPVQQAVQQAINSNDPIMKLQAVRDHYNELLTSSTDMNTVNQGRNLVSFLDNLISSAQLRQQSIRQGNLNTVNQPFSSTTTTLLNQQQPIMSTSTLMSSATTTTPLSQLPLSSSSGRQVINVQPILGRAFLSQPSAQPIMQQGSSLFSSSRPSVGLFQSSYSSQSSVCAALNIDQSIEKNAQNQFTVKIKPLENMEFVDLHMQFNNDAGQQVNTRVSPVEGVSANQEIHLPLQLDTNQNNIQYYLTTKPVGKGYQCDTPIFAFNA